MEKLYVALIDDDYDDASLLKECFHKFHSYSVYSFSKGSAFFNFVEQTPEERLCLMVVDLNLPEIDGIDIIKAIKKNAPLSSIPILVFTTGGTPAEIEFCKANNIQLFKKPSSIREWESIALAMASHCDPGVLQTK